MTIKKKAVNDVWRSKSDTEIYAIVVDCFNLIDVYTKEKPREKLDSIAKYYHSEKIQFGPIAFVMKDSGRIKKNKKPSLTRVGIKPIDDPSVKCKRSQQLALDMFAAGYSVHTVEKYVRLFRDAVKSGKKIVWNKSSKPSKKGDAGANKKPNDHASLSFKASQKSRNNILKTLASQGRTAIEKLEIDEQNDVGVGVLLDFVEWAESQMI